MRLIKVKIKYIYINSILMKFYFKFYVRLYGTFLLQKLLKPTFYYSSMFLNICNDPYD